MKVGDLIRVRYNNSSDPTKWYHGFICESPTAGRLSCWKMWCIEQGCEHILFSTDDIEVINESR